MKVDFRSFFKSVVHSRFEPNPLQQAVWDTYYRQAHPALLIRAATGSGKTEAALLPPLAEDNRRIFIILPSKALVEDQTRRVVELLQKLSAQRRKSYGLTMDMGGVCHRWQLEQGQSKLLVGQKRHLFFDDVIITTLDKFVYYFFGYTGQRKSFIFPQRIFGKVLGKAPLLIFDEAHDYEGLAYANFQKLLLTLYTKGIDLIVMSATLPHNFASFLDIIDSLTPGHLKQEQERFQCQTLQMHHPGKKLTLIPAANTAPDNQKFIAQMVELINQKYDPAKRIIIRIETIRDLCQLYQYIRDKKPYVYHGRLPYNTPQYGRKEVMAKLLQAQKQDQGFLLLTTSAIEVGCDLDAHLLITEYCNPDSLVQTAGRLNRRGKMPDAELIVVGQGIKPFLAYLSSEEQKEYQTALAAMAGNFQPEKLQNFFQPPRQDWRGEILFDMLYDYVYECDLTCKPLWDRGILITRSWEPSIYLGISSNPNTEPLQHPIQIKLTALKARLKPRDPNNPSSQLEYFSVTPQTGSSSKGELIWHAQLFRHVFYAEQGPHRNQYKELTSKVSAYEASLVCAIHPEFQHEYYQDELGYVQIPKILCHQHYWGLYEETLIHQPHFTRQGAIDYKKTNNGRVWYLRQEQ